MNVTDETVGAIVQAVQESAGREFDRAMGNRRWIEEQPEDAPKERKETAEKLNEKLRELMREVYQSGALHGFTMGLPGGEPKKNLA